MRCSRGFSLVELVVAMAIMLSVTATAFMLMVPSQATFSSQTEVADMQQRLRVASDTLSQILIAAGVGAYAAGDGGALINLFAPVLPYRSGGANPDPPGSYKRDTITIFSVPRGAAQPVSATYWLKSDAVASTYQLMVNESTSAADVPVVDHVVGLAFEYYGDPQPPTMRLTAANPPVAATTYGPKPPVGAVPPFVAGENCVFVNDGSPTPQPRLSHLGAGGTALVKLTPAQLADGPWCPDDAAAGRWDADLLRIRSIAVTVRVQAALSASRGPVSVFFAHAGSSRGNPWVPDQEIRFQVSPRNMNLGR